MSDSRTTFQLSLSGMHCGHCVHAVEELLSSTEGISQYSVSIGSGRMESDSTWDGLEELKVTLEREGYRVQDVQPV